MFLLYPLLLSICFLIDSIIIFYTARVLYISQESSLMKSPLVFGMWREWSEWEERSDIMTASWRKFPHDNLVDSAQNTPNFEFILIRLYRSSWRQPLSLNRAVLEFFNQSSNQMYQWKGCPQWERSCGSNVSVKRVFALAQVAISIFFLFRTWINFMSVPHSVITNSNRTVR